MNAEIFLQKYRIIEGLLEKRYESEKKDYSSVVIEYLHDADSCGIRTELDLLREIRNLLSHNADTQGQPVVEPSDEMISLLDDVIEFIKVPRDAVNFGTPAKYIMSASPNDNLFEVMRSMMKNGYSHVPIVHRGCMTGVLCTRSVFGYLAEMGLDSLDNETRIVELGDQYALTGRPANAIALSAGTRPS